MWLKSSECLFILGIAGSVSMATSLSNSANTLPTSSSRRHWLKHHVPAATIASLNLLVGGGLMPSRAEAEPLLPDTLNLQPPTKDQPQIPLPESLPAGPQPLAQGLIYLKDPKRSRPPLDSVILVTVRQSNDDPSSPVIAAAKLPCRLIRFPVQFQFDKENVRRRGGVADLNLLERQDLLVQAVVCPEENIDRDAATCRTDSSQQDSFLSAVGTAKLLQFPGKEGGDGVKIRAAVSLGLE